MKKKKAERVTAQLTYVGPEYAHAALEDLAKHARTKRDTTLIGIVHLYVQQLEESLREERTRFDDAMGEMVVKP